MPNSSASIQMLGYEAAKIAKSKSRDNSPTIPESSLKPQPFQTCWKFDAK